MGYASLGAPPGYKLGMEGLRLGVSPYRRSKQAGSGPFGVGQLWQETQEPPGVTGVCVQAHTGFDGCLCLGYSEKQGHVQDRLAGALVLPTMSTRECPQLR